MSSRAGREAIGESRRRNDAGVVHSKRPGVKLAVSVRNHRAVGGIADTRSLRSGLQRDGHRGGKVAATRGDARTERRGALPNIQAEILPGGKIS